MSDLLATLAAWDAERQRKLIAWLPKLDGPARRLIDILAACSPGTPCRSAACPVCGREFQRRALDLVEEAIRKPARERLRNRMSMITITPTIGIAPPDELTVEVCCKVVKQVKAALAELGLVAVAALDVSFNEDAENEVEPHWCVHVHVVVLNWLTPSQRDALNAKFFRSRLVKRPVHVVELDQRENGRLYTLKSDRVRRVSFIERNHPNRNPHRDTKRRELRPDQAATLAIVEHRLGIEKRLITNRIDKNAIEAAFDGFYHARDGPWSLLEGGGTAPTR